jgi:hypothetical protein
MLFNGWQKISLQVQSCPRVSWRMNTNDREAFLLFDVNSSPKNVYRLLSEYAEVSDSIFVSTLRIYKIK